eukprot:Phypoly_transcript_03836.p1 GENE.Phypoly_transcript_03836~~Phypoly_transcript_03836.p1  ORF type:complete len:711 (-),score=171.32 Phypoly_transcript_03836:18-2150(-)
MSLVVKCSDGIVVHVDKDIITKFSVGFQKKLAECESETAPIIIDNVNSRSLLKVVEYCTVHNDPSISAADLKSWDNKFVKVEPSVLCELASAAYHLEIKPMVDLTCYAIAQLLKGNTPEEIRRIFNIIYDFGPEDDVPPPTIRDKLRNRWIRKTNGKRSSVPPSHSSSDFTNPLVQALAIQNAPPTPSPASSLPASLPPSSTPQTPSEPLSTHSTSEEGTPAVDGAASPTNGAAPTSQPISDTRSVEELLSFINSDETKTKTKAKKAKKKKKKGESHNHPPNPTATPAHPDIAMKSNGAAAQEKKQKQKEKEKKEIPKNKTQQPTNQPAKDNDKKQRSRKNNATSNPEMTSSPSTTNKHNTNNKRNSKSGKKKSLHEKLSESSLSGSESSETYDNQVAEEEEGVEAREEGEVEEEAEGEAEGEEAEGEEEEGEYGEGECEEYEEGEGEGEGEGEYYEEEGEYEYYEEEDTCDACKLPCKRPRDPPCAHPCPLPCHIGPCPECVKLVKHRCLCGSTVLTMECHVFTKAKNPEDVKCCGQPCMKSLPACSHECQQICHSGPCSAECPKVVTTKCPCGRIKTEISCNKAQEMRKTRDVRKKEYLTLLVCDEQCEILKQETARLKKEKEAEEAAAAASHEPTTQIRYDTKGKKIVEKSRKKEILEARKTFAQRIRLFFTRNQRYFVAPIIAIGVCLFIWLYSQVYTLRKVAPVP